MFFDYFISISSVHFISRLFLLILPALYVFSLHSIALRPKFVLALVFIIVLVYVLGHDN